MSSVLPPNHKAILVVGVVFLLGMLIVSAASVYNAFVINVRPKQFVVLTSKTGQDIANDDEVAPLPNENGVFKGVQQEVLGEGRYFRDPYHWEWEVHEQLEIPKGKLGVRTRLVGDDLPYGQFLATKETQKGIVPGFLREGARYVIHPYMEKVEMYDPVFVPAGFQGVVTNLAGPLPDNPNVAPVEDDCRGVQKTTLGPETYYFNPFEKRVSLIDCRSQRINLAEELDLGFPTKDGFWVNLDGIIEFRVIPEEASHVFVMYNEDANGEGIQEEIRNKVLLPNARSFCRLEGSNSLGRELIQGETRTKFQEKFEAALRIGSKKVGIEVSQALITRIRPPEKIASPIRTRELAKQQLKQYSQQTLQQKSEKDLAIQKEMVNQKQAVVRADQEVVKITIDAQREQEVAVTKANQQKSVAQFKLNAAKDEAEAIMSRGKATADVVRFNNEAAAAGWKEAVAAFAGDGQKYARYVLLQKLAPAYRSIMANTADSPIMEIFKAFNDPSNAPSREKK